MNELTLRKIFGTAAMAVVVIALLLVRSYGTDEVKHELRRVIGLLFAVWGAVGLVYPPWAPMAGTRGMSDVEYSRKWHQKMFYPDWSRRMSAGFFLLGGAALFVSKPRPEEEEDAEDIEPPKTKPLGVCPACGANAEPDSNFCDQCGEDLRVTPDNSPTENR